MGSKVYHGGEVERLRLAEAAGCGGGTAAGAGSEGAGGGSGRPWPLQTGYTPGVLGSTVIGGRDPSGGEELARVIDPAGGKGPTVGGEVLTAGGAAPR